MDKDEKILDEAKKRWEITEDKLHDERNLMLEDIKFSIGDSDNGYQWPDALLRERNAERRPALTMNKLPQFINQVKNEARANRPQIKIRPVDNGADKEDAEIYQGLVKNIESVSNADVAYDTSIEYSARCGIGYVRVITDYADEYSFNQDIIIKNVPDPLSIRLDPSYCEPDGSDAMWGFVEDSITKDVFESTYPEADMTSWATSDHGDWLTDGNIRIVEYFRIKEIPKNLLLLSDGSTVFEGEAMPEGVTVAKKRKGKKRECEWFKLTCSHVLERTVIKCSFIPIVPVIGNEVYINGRPHRSGMVRNAKDPMRQYNYWATAETEMIALAPKAPYIGYAGQFTDPKWQDANHKNYAYLEVSPIDVLGERAPIPQRQQFAGVPAGIVNAKAGSNQDIRECVGMYNASVGAPSSETSGRAILAKQREGDTGTFHYADNQARMIRQVGRIIVEMIPHYYDVTRVARILGEDGDSDDVIVSPDTDKPLTKFKDNEGNIKRIFNPNVGKYDITVTVGASFATRRIEASESMVELARVIPAIANIAPDLITRSFDFEGADEIADRLKASLPPQVTGQGEENIPPEVQQKIQQIKLVSEQLAAKEQELMAKEQELQQVESTVKGEIDKLSSQKAVFDANSKALKLEIENQIMKAQKSQGNEIQEATTYTKQLESMVEQLSNTLEAITEE